jgi:hypothetical protein
MSGRLVVMVVIVALVMGGPLAPWAAAQQPAPTEQPPDTGQPPMVQQPPTAAEERAWRRVFRWRVDLYDAGALAMTVVGAPLKGVVCVVGGAVGVTLFLLTFGSADRASAAVVREGCAQNWIVRGSDIRPEPSP